MIDVTIKTLDSQNHRYSVPDDITVKQFKDRIASSVNIPSDKQRLIYCGRVLNDDKNLSEYNVHEKVIHLVMRAPPQPNSRNSDSRPTGASSNEGGPRIRQTTGPSSSGMRLQQAKTMLNGAISLLNTMEADVEANASNGQDQQEAGPSNASPLEEPMEVSDVGRDSFSESSDEQELEPNAQSTPNGPTEAPASRPQNNLPEELEYSYQEMDALNNMNPSNDEGPHLMAMASGMGHPLIGSMTNGLQGGLVQAASAAFVSALSSIGASPVGSGGRAWTSVSSVPATSSSNASRPSAPPASSTAPRLIPNGPTPNAISISPPSGRSSSSGGSPSRSQHGPPSNSEGSLEGVRGFTVRITNRGSPQMTNIRLSHPRCNVMVDVLNQYREAQRRLQPFLDQYYNIMAEDRTYEAETSNDNVNRDQLLVFRVSSCLHYISHAMHAISDIMIDLRRAPPRQLRARPFIIPQPALVQAQINVAPPATADGPTSSSANTRSGANDSMTSDSSVSADTAGDAPASRSTEDASRPSGPDTSFVSVSDFVDEDNEVVLMHVGPNGITIDSLSSEEGGDSGSNPPPGLFHNLMSLASQFRMRHADVQGSQATSATSSTGSPSTTGPGVRRATPVHNSQAAGNSGTNTTNATQTRVTHRPHQVHVTPLHIPGVGMMQFDQFLPCQSHHNRMSSTRRRHRATVQTSTRVNRASAPTVQTPENTRANRPSDTGSSAPQGESDIPTPSLSLMIDLLTGLFMGANPSVQGNQQQQEQMIRQLAQIVLSQISEGMNPENPGYNQSLEDFMEPFVTGGLFNDGDSDSVFSRLFFTISQSLSMGDLVQIIFGNLTSLNRLREPIQRFIRDSLLNGELNEVNTNNAVEEIFSDLNIHLTEIVDNASVRSGIDFMRTLRNFIKLKLQNLFNLILNHDDSDSFGSSLMVTLRQSCHEFVRLSLHCFTDGTSGLERMVEGRVRSIMNGMNPAVQSWSISVSLMQLRSTLSNLTVTDEQVRQYVVQTTEATETADRFEADRSSAPSSQAPHATSSNTQGIRSEESAQPEEFVEVMEAEDVSASTTNGAGGAQNSLPENIGSRSWHSAVPQEWIPVIARDVERQRRRVPETNLSDGYLCGMPMKRRKLATKNKPNGSVQKVFQDTLRQSLSNSGVNRTVVDSVSNEVSTELSEAFANQARNMLQEELKENEDFNPERFPNSEKHIRNK